MTDPSEPLSSISDDLTDGIIGNTIYDFDTPKKKEFLPWHRPRKQYVREKQWEYLITDLVTETPPRTGTINYLGLPGDDLFDLRHFHDKICIPKNLKLKFLGFNKGMKPGAEHNTQLEISLDEVNRLSHIHDGSDLLPDDLTAIALEKSVAWMKSENMGPFDVINIDLCDGFAKQPANEFKQTHYNTLYRLMYLQAKRQDPWLLMLTTRTNTECVDANVFETLKQVYRDNLADCEDFLNASNECFTVSDEDSFLDYCSESTGFTNVFLTSLCKWILTTGLRQNPPTKVEVKNVLGYTVAKEADSPDLMSIAIKITPTYVAMPDPIGLANQEFNQPSECLFASRILKRVHRKRDVDEILAGDEQVMNTMIENTSTLLDQARYDTSDYAIWVQNVL
ncbi:PP_RS20740 family protein [Dyadobacter fanqingshengii]|uniref:Uncharacterized protein n=1 Tax=Dyadobacter fanqingshengii TaxID=2906443 RepID=A0A9X1PE35_9BACT|nr:hypothetical protein [Dyadobacter fanqingshengii]MCF0041562.1 hypothetical protein [Dyadobacter fanqingshengii]USJ36721.1 hypothetical protein NFI81_02890 [Dyadobacter fanqingshengii]